MRFKIGQEIVCIAKNWDHDSGPHHNIPNPIYNEIYICDGYYDNKYLFIDNIKLCAYNEANFAPILSNIDEIKEILKEPIEI